MVHRLDSPRRLGTLAAITATCLLAAGCGPREQEPPPPLPEPEAPPSLETPAGFAHDPDFDPAGYYMPMGEIAAGGVRLRRVAMGAVSDFQQWEDGAREGLYGPILIQFDPVEAEALPEEPGAPTPDPVIELKPETYQVSLDRVSFSANDPNLGRVAFSGAYDNMAFAIARRESVGDSPVLVGDLQIGDTLFEDVEFTYWTGD
jgi:hypothetical protein